MVYMDYALIGNCQGSALVKSNGDVVWCCMPTLDSPSVFARLLDQEKGGHFAIQPQGAYLTEQAYRRNTNILETTYTSPDWCFKVIDFMPRWSLNAEAQCYTGQELYRLIEVIRGTPKVVVEFNPQLDYARGTTTVSAMDPMTLIASNQPHSDAQVFLSTNIVPDAILNHEPVELNDGDFFAVAYGQPVVDLTTGHVLDKLQKTSDYWRHWVKTCYLPKQYQKEIIRSALTLKMLVYEPTGAIIAAPTTSIPEIIGGNRNWDYRFCWLRDAYFIIEALLKLSRFEVVEGFIGYLKGLLTDKQTQEYLRPMFTIDGTVVPEEISLRHLEGYLGSKPVHVGNSATTHYQNDVYGEMVLALYPMFTDERVVRDDTEQLWGMIEYLVAIAIKKFDEEDNGLWEFRNFPRHYTFSKLMCWVALDRGCKIARLLNKEKTLRVWSKEKQRMRADILERAWNPDIQAFTQAYGSEHLDASTLLMPLLGIIDAKDPRMLSTILLSEEKLMVNGLAFRYTNTDDFGDPENSFTICTFWMIDALILIGQKRRARKYFENVLQYANHVGLFSEDVNPKSGELTGNFPQGYTHVAIINTAMLLASQPRQPVGV